MIAGRQRRVTKGKPDVTSYLCRYLQGEGGNIFGVATNTWVVSWEFLNRATILQDHSLNQTHLASKCRQVFACKFLPLLQPAPAPASQGLLKPLGVHMALEKPGENIQDGFGTKHVCWFWPPGSEPDVESQSWNMFLFMGLSNLQKLSISGCLDEHPFFSCGWSFWLRKPPALVLARHYSFPMVRCGPQPAVPPKGGAARRPSSFQTGHLKNQSAYRWVGKKMRVLIQRNIIVEYVNICVYVNIYIYVYIYIHICIYIYIFIYVCMCVCVYVCMYACAYLYLTCLFQVLGPSSPYTCSWYPQPPCGARWGGKKGAYAVEGLLAGASQEVVYRC